MRRGSRWHLSKNSETKRAIRLQRWRLSVALSSTRRSIALSRWTQPGAYRNSTRRRSGYSALREQKWLARNWPNCLSPRDFARHRQGLAHYLKTGQGPLLGRLIEIGALRRDGTEILVALAISATEIDGSPIFTAYLRDIT